MCRAPVAGHEQAQVAGWVMFHHAGHALLGKDFGIWPNRNTTTETRYYVQPVVDDVTQRTTWLGGGTAME